MRPSFLALFGKPETPQDVAEVALELRTVSSETGAGQEDILNLTAALPVKRRLTIADSYLEPEADRSGGTGLAEWPARAWRIWVRPTRLIVAVRVKGFKP